jgi:hypothetical protein
MKSARRLYLLAGAAVALSFAFGASVCHAKIGDTLEQCIANYGQPLKSKNQTWPVGSTAYLFKKDNWIINLVIFNGIVGYETISKRDKSDFTAAEIKALLDSESDGLSWTKKSPLTGALRIAPWVRDDHEVVLSYIREDKLVCLDSRRFRQADDSRDK